MLKVWELSDLDRDGMLDKDEFSVVRNELISQIEINHISYGYSLQKVSAHVFIVLTYSNCAVSRTVLLHSYSRHHNKVFPGLNCFNILDF